jgi:hypothetical protein
MPLTLRRYQFVQNFGGHSNGFKLLEGEDAGIRSSYLLLMCGVD